MVRKLGELAAPQADWLLADFEIAPTGPARWRSRLIVALLYRFFRLVTGLKADALTPPDRDLEKAGFTRHRRITSEWGLLKSEWWRRLPTAEPNCESDPKSRHKAPSRMLGPPWRGTS